jgi:anti-sigma-K factor RskA
MTDTLPDMSPDMTPDEALALEWALGVLDEPARAAAEARRQAEPAFAALCAHWAASLAPLSDEVDPVKPSRGVWETIEAEIVRPSFNGTEEAPATRSRPSFWASLAVWRTATAAFAALALALLVARPTQTIVVQQPPSAAAGSLLATTLSGEAGDALATAQLDTDRRQIILSPVKAASAGDRVPELWLIPADGTPRSLGVISLGGAQRVTVPETVLQLVADGATLAVSLEPVGGSPTGLPTGPVVATGKLATI